MKNAQGGTLVPVMGLREVVPATIATLGFGTLGGGDQLNAERRVLVVIDVPLVRILVVPVMFVLGLSFGWPRARIRLLRDSSRSKPSHKPEQNQPQ